MNQPTDPKVALVTGGAQGIGRGICARFLREGIRVAIADADAQALEDATRQWGDQILTACLDIADEPSVRECVRRIDLTWGRLDILVNNAGIGANAPIETLELSEWNRVIATNLTGLFLCTKHAVPLLRRSKGAIVNIASTRALQSEPHSEAYAATKGGIVAVTHALAASLGPKVRVNCVSPGWIEVGDWKKPSQRTVPIHRPQDLAQHFVGRVGRPDDIASLVSYLCSEQAGFITGQNLVVDGGMTRKMIYEE